MMHRQSPQLLALNMSVNFSPILLIVEMLRAPKRQTGERVPVRCQNSELRLRVPLNWLFRRRAHKSQSSLAYLTRHVVVGCGIVVGKVRVLLQRGRHVVC